MSLRLNGSTSGYSELEAPAVAGDQTFTLPGTGGTLVTTASAGKILQVVSNSSSTTLSNSTTTYNDLITASITPASASNQVIILASCTLSITANTNSYAGTAVFRGTTSGTNITARSAGFDMPTSGAVSFSIAHIDSPSTTSAQTYTFAFRKGSGNTTSVDTNGVIYSIILLEVAV